MRRVAYHEGRCDALAGRDGEDTAVDNYMASLRDLEYAEQVHADRVIDPNTSAAYDFRREAVQDRDVPWLLQQHQAHAHDPDAQEVIAERLAERENSGEPMGNQGRHAIGRAKKRIADGLVRDGLYTPEQAAASVDGWFGHAPDESMSQAQAAGHSEIQARREYEDMVAFEYLRATEETRGTMLSRRGVAAGVSAESLFRGPLAKVEPYASEELRAYWARHGRLTWAAYRYEALGRDSDRAAFQRSKTYVPDDVAMVS